ncbi:MAG TPA: POTRA domain-containing protein [Terracidiphilus sp.]
MRFAGVERYGWAGEIAHVCILGALLAGISLGCSAAEPVLSLPDQNQIARLQGQIVRHVSFEGVAPGRLASIRTILPQAVDTPLDDEKVAASLRQLYATGLFATVEAEAESGPDGITLIFHGTPRMFLGTVTVDGAKGATVNTQLERAARLTPGTRFTQAKMTEALETMRQVLLQNGYYEPEIHHDLTQHPEQQLTDIAFHVASGPHARIGAVEVSGDSGMTADEFRRLGHLRQGAPIDRDTVNRSLTGVLKYYRRQKRFEAEIKLESQDYAARKVNYRFTAVQGPVVKVVVEGASIDELRLKRLVPIFEEGSVDDDLLNEGNRRIRDYLQSLGYFDVKVDHRTTAAHTGEVLIAYNVNLGVRSRVQKVAVEGNRYFDSPTLEQLLGVHAATSLDRHGDYSQALVSADVAALETVYRNNGFSNVKVTPETHAGSAEPQQSSAAVASPAAELVVIYHIAEGVQQRVGSLRFEGNDHIDGATLAPLLNTEPGQLLSPKNLAGDRDTLATEYVGRGFDRVTVQVEETSSPADPAKANVIFHIAEGRQFFVGDVLLTGLHYTRPATVAGAITLHPGDPLSQAELEETQRNLYEYALFNEINLAVENPNGEETHKTVLLQATEARRWAFTYGGGFELQTGTPVSGCRGIALASGASCTPNGKTGISPRLVGALTRENLFGREQLASIQGTYGLLEQRLDLIYQNPRFIAGRKFGLTFTGGYANSQDVTTYVASRLEAGFRLTQTFNRPGAGLARANTFVYGFDFRRVKVAEPSLEVFPDKTFIDSLAAAVRVGGPSFTWLRDSRDNPVDARRGTYLSFQEFVSAAPFGAEAHFNRIDTSYSSYYAFDKNRFVLARNTRYGQERAFGPGSGELLPLPERLYAGGATSLRGFSVNAAGPRDPDTGFPIGGAGAFVNNLELRLPPTPLPYVGNAVSVVLFHDMGNIFNNASDVWPSLIRIHQPDRDVCKVPTPPQTNAEGKLFLPDPGPPTTSTGPHGGPDGACSFNYFSHAPGMGLRYHTPVGPIRFDFSYNLNPPIYPINVDYSQEQPFANQHVGEAGHFNFFFSLGQTF